MIMDSQNLFSQNQAVTATVNSTNVIDLGILSPQQGGTIRDIGIGEPDVEFFVAVTQAATAAGAATLQVALVAADDAALTTNVITLMQTEAIGKADLTAGVQLLRTGVPANRKYNGQRYLGVIYTVATGPLTAGTFTAGLVTDTQANVAYPEGNNVSGF